MVVAFVFIGRVGHCGKVRGRGSWMVVLTFHSAWGDGIIEEKYCFLDGCCHEMTWVSRLASFSLALT